MASLNPSPSSRLQKPHRPELLLVQLLWVLVRRMASSLESCLVISLSRDEFVEAGVEAVRGSPSPGYASPGSRFRTFLSGDHGAYGDGVKLLHGHGRSSDLDYPHVLDDVLEVAVAGDAVEVFSPSGASQPAEPPGTE